MAIDVAAFTDLEAVAADAGVALDRAQQSRLFDRIDWYRLLAAHCPLPGTPLILRARDGEGAAWLFLTRQSRRANAFANWYSLETGPITHGLIKPALIAALARHLLSVEKLTGVTLAPLGEDKAKLAQAAFREAGWIARSVQTTTNWSIALPGVDWATYFSARPRRLQNTLKRKLKHDIRIDISNKFSNDSWDFYEQVYKASWKSEEGSPAFLRALAAAEGHAGHLRLGLAYDGSTLVAAQFWLVENGEATIHKLAHVEARRGRSPGTVLTAAMFRHVIEQDKVRRIDFGTGDDAYKADWMDQQRPLFTVSFHNPRTAAGLLGAARERLSAARAAFRRTA
jgi:CelD/BcsL family acetyltransferase involved in cellulose biosynthesis